MSCPSEITLSVYVDGELEPDALRRAEMHLVSCRDCRTRVVALQDEASLLANAILERTPARIAPRPSSAPSADLAWGLPAAIGGVTALLAIIGVLVDLRLPGVLDLLNPKRLMGVYELAFDSVFLLKNRLPEVFELAVAVGAVASISALGCALVHALSQRLLKSSTLLLTILLVVAGSGPARAVEFRIDEDTSIPAGETVSETLICTGDVVTIDGTIDGDLVAGAERVTLRGTVTGNVYVFGDEVEIDGIVEGSVLVVGGRTRLAAKVGGSAVLAGDRPTIGESAEIARDAALFGDGARMEGRAARDVVFAGGWIEVRGEIGRDLHVLGADTITLLDSARIGRNLRAHLAEGPEAIERAPGATVGGEVQVETESIVKEHYLAVYREPSFYLAVLVASAAAFVFGLLVYVLDPRLFEADAPNARSFFRSLGTGFIILLAGPVAIVLAGLTVVGIPVAILGLFLFSLSVYTAFILVAGLIGRSVLPPSRSGLSGFAPSLLVGVLILSAVAVLPFLGPPVRIVAVLFGLGCLFERVRGLHALNLRGIRMGE